jgi:cytochrome c551/c552
MMINGSMKVCLTALGTMAVALGSLAITVGGCSSSSNSATTGTGSGTGSGSGTGTGGDAAAAAACTSNFLTVSFAPMYSAVIPGDTTHTFQIPAIVTGINAAGVAQTTWSASNNSVSLAADPTTGGILITMSPTGTAGTVTITANAGGGLCGQSTLNITSATLADWQAGSDRYNNGVALSGLGPSGAGGPQPDGGAVFACTDCHAPKGTDAGPGFNDVAHTPEQTGGYSDEQLLGIVQSGEVPGWSTDAGPAADAGYFDTSIVPYRQWHRFHQWGLTTAEQKGIVVYLRSLTPAAQTGTSNFGGFGPPPDGGYPHHHDGGPGGGQPDATVGSGSGSGTADAATGG